MNAPTLKVAGTEYRARMLTIGEQKVWASIASDGARAGDDLAVLDSFLRQAAYVMRGPNDLPPTTEELESLPLPALMSFMERVGKMYEHEPLEPDVGRPPSLSDRVVGAGVWVSIGLVASNAGLGPRAVPIALAAGVGHVLGSSWVAKLWRKASEAA